MAFVTITAGQTDTDSPIDQVLMDTVRLNLDDVDSRAVDNGNSHNHEGGDGAQIPTDGFVDESVTSIKNGVLWERVSYAARTGTTLDEFGITLASTVGVSGDYTNQTDTTDNWVRLRVDNDATTTYLWDSAVTESGHENILKVRIKPTANFGDIRLWVGFANDNTLINASAIPDDHVSAFRFDTDASDTNWQAVTIAGTGASAEITDTGVTVSASITYDFAIVTTASEHKFYIDSTLVATNNTTVPTSTTALGIFIGATSLSDAGSARGIHMNSTRLSKDI